MKDKIFAFVVGLLIGAIITASGFLIYEKNNTNTNQQQSSGEMQMMERPEGGMPDGEPPDKPDGMENDDNRPDPPSKNNSSTNTKTSQE